MSHASGIAITDDEVKPYSIYVCQKCVEEAKIDEGEEAYSEHLDIYG
jgi:putative lipase involved disintegration of autophagic bodies